MIDSMESLILGSLSSVDHVIIKNDSEKHQGHKHYSQNSHFKITIISDDFINTTRLDRHKSILAILNKTIAKNNIHSISLSLLTSEECNKIESAK